MEEEPEAASGAPAAEPFETVVVLPAPGTGEPASGSGAAAEREPADEAREPRRAQAQDTLRPVFTPFTVSPRLRNSAEVSAALQAHYPPLLRDAGIGGDVMVWFYIDAAGVVRRIQLKESSGYEALDAAAMRIAGLMEFTPALNRDQRVPVWVSIPFKFRSGPERPPPLARERPVVPAPPMAREEAAARAAPTFTPFTRPPEVVNGDEVARALQRYYPPLLRDAGLGGTVHLWLFVETDGTVSRSEVATSSGYDALDDAALRVARDMRFSPAVNRATTVAVWIQVPVIFSAR
jgi:TonB family protein